MAAQARRIVQAERPGSNLVYGRTPPVSRSGGSRPPYAEPWRALSRHGSFSHVKGKYRDPQGAQRYCQDDSAEKPPRPLTRAACHDWPRFLAACRSISACTAELAWPTNSA
jgi:hypothetical protein